MAKPSSWANLGPERLALHRSGRQVVVVVEPDLAHGAHPAIPQALTQGRDQIVREVLGVVRMHAGGNAHGRKRGQRPALSPARSFGGPFGGHHGPQVGRGFHKPARQRLEGGEAVIGGIHDGFHEGHAVHRAAGQLQRRVAQHLQVRVGVGHRPLDHRRLHLAPHPVLALLAELPVVEYRLVVIHAVS